MATKSYRSYLAFIAPDEMIQTVEEAINKQGIKEANKGNIAKLEICKKSYREDIVIGDLYVVPSSVCKKAEDFPIALLASGVFVNLNQEEAIEARMQFLASEDMSKDTLKMAKEMLFKNADGEECDLVVFHPAWANIADIKVIHYNKETLFLDLRDKVFNSLYNPALSNSFEQIKAITGTYRVESIPLQQHVFKTPRYGTEYPDLEKGSEIEAEDIKIDDKSRTSATVGKEALKDLKIKTTFRLIASSLVKPEESRKKIRLSAAHIEELEESILEPEELKLFNKIEDVLENKIGSQKDLSPKEADALKLYKQKYGKDWKSILTNQIQKGMLVDSNVLASIAKKLGIKKEAAETGLRNREDYGAPGSKETVGPEMVDGPDPKKAGSDDVIEDAKMIIQYLKTQVKNMEESGSEDQATKYDKMFSDYITLENFVRTGGKNGSGQVQQIIQDHMVNMPDSSAERKDVKNRPAQVISSDEDTKVVVEMPVKDFVKEHKNLVDVLEHGSDEEQFEEGVDQGEELKKVETTDYTEASSEDILREEMPMDADDWFKHDFEEPKKATKKMVSKVKPKNAFTLLVPGQVLEGFYPELAEQLAIQPLGRENYHSPTPEILQKNLQQQDSGDAVRPPAGLGLGPNEPTGGVPLRKELNLRGPGFTNTFYGPHDDISPNSLLMASAKKSKNASLDNKMKLSEILKKICGQIASSLIAGFQVTSKPLFTDIPMEWTLNLRDLENGIQLQNAGTLPVNQTGFGFKAIAEGLNDSDLTDALNGAWAQGAVWNDEGDTGFTYEVFVRAEKLDIEGMNLKVKYVIKKKD